MEERLLSWIHGLSTPGLDAAFLASHWLGCVWASAALVLGLAVFYRACGERRLALLWLLAGVAVLVIEESLKLLIARPRPQLWAPLIGPSDYAFPSGHAMASAAFYPLLASVLAHRGVAGRRRLLYIAAGLSGFIGLGRVYLGVHWPTDVLAGWTLGAALALIAIRLLPRCGCAPGEAPPASPSPPKGE